MTEERIRPPQRTEPAHEEDSAVAEPPASALVTTLTRPVAAGHEPAGNGAAGMGGVRGTAAPEPWAAPGTVSPTGSGQDVRHRGWYWHWNTLITQYAPLLGLKGVGLLNSYTVWTDRREGSPHQGYAFPAQESEAHFYGEGREELITLNKLLVALDLIAIHKEMVLRQDARGRRWRVPHNFYRVKDPRDGLVLSLPAVVRVLELAQRDRNVFRHIRHVFGPQFAPIDRTSLWHVLLPQLRELPLWQELAAQAARERRVSRKATRTEGETTGSADASAADSSTPMVVPDVGDSAAFTDPGAKTIGLTDDEARTFSTFLTSGTASINDRGEHTTDNAASHRANTLPRPYAVAHADAENATSAPIVPDVGGSDAERHSTDDEGTTSVVCLDDRMYYQEGESGEETTRTSSTNSHTRTHAHTREQRPEPERGRGRTLHDPTPSPADELFHENETSSAGEDVSHLAVSPPRPAVSDLFAALAERTRLSQSAVENGNRREILPAAAEVMAHGRLDDDATPGAEEANGDTERIDATHTPESSPLSIVAPAGDAADAAVAPFDPHDLPDPDTAPGQPLPPTPGETGIVVRALDVREAGIADATHAAQLAEIETALTMANGRQPSDMELSLLWQVAQDCDATARTGPGPGSGVGWVLAAIWEAVNSGSSFVAPKRVAAICDRWVAEGFMSDGRAAATATAIRALHPPPRLAAPEPEPEREPSSEPEQAAVTTKEPEPEVPVPDEEGVRLWAGVVRRLDGVLHADALGSRTFTAARITATAGGHVTVQAPDGESAARLGKYRGLIARRLSDVLGHTVADVRFVGEDDAPAPDAAPVPAPLPTTGNEPLPVVAPASAPMPQERPAPPAPAALTSVVPPTIPTFTVPGTTRTSGELWAHALHALSGAVSEATFKVWLQSTALIAADADGTLVIGARNRVQRERLERQHTGEIAAALGDLTGQVVTVRVAVIGTPEGDAR